MKWALFIAVGLAVAWWLKNRTPVQAASLPMIWVGGAAYQPAQVQSAQMADQAAPPVIPAPDTFLRGGGGGKILRAYPLYNAPDTGASPSGSDSQLWGQ